MSIQGNGSTREFKELPRVKVFETVVRARVGVRAKLQIIDLPTGKIRLLRYEHAVKGGQVSVHVRHDDPGQFKGRKITAHCELWRRTNDDGSQDFYIDLYPVEGEARHRLCVTEGTVPASLKRGQRFAVPAPKQGQVIFAVMG